MRSHGLVGLVLLVLAAAACGGDSAKTVDQGAGALGGRATPSPAGPVAAARDGSAGVSITVDASATHPISSYIYGVAQSDGADASLGQMGATVVRWGGNARTRFNWEINASNAGSDYGFCNLEKGSGGPGEAAATFVARNRAIGAASLLTIPTIGWVARDTDACSEIPDDLWAGGGDPSPPGSERIKGYDPGPNRERTSVPSVPAKGQAFACPPDLTDGRVFQDEWVYCLTRAVGPASAGGVGFYALDNEPDLWADNTHVDVHPVRPGYDEIRDRVVEYAAAVKAVDPSALVLAPVVSGWCGYFFSPRDKCEDGPDRKAHGDRPFLPWLLSELRAAEEKGGRRLVDVLDVHYYPQGGSVYKGATDAETNARRLRSTRSLWDPTYQDESWIGRTSDEACRCVRLIPRLREWIGENYPGTRIGITEWNFGADDTVNGALAIADVLGIFGREQVFLATYWQRPQAGSPGDFAFRMYRNYDGKGGAFGDVAASTSSSEPDLVSAYGSLDQTAGQLKVMLVNKSPDQAVDAALRLDGFTPGKTEVWRYSGEDIGAIRRLPDLAPADGGLAVSLPAYSVTLLVIHPGP